MRGDSAAPPSATRSRWGALPAFFGFLLIGVLALALTLPGLLGFLHGVAHRLPLVAFRPREAVGPPVALGFVALAGITLSDPAVNGRRRLTWKNACLAAIMVAALATVVAIPVGETAASSTMTALGYERCANPPTWHHPPMRWMRPGGHCP